jgi:hypothetical protein
MDHDITRLLIDAISLVAKAVAERTGDTAADDAATLLGRARVLLEQQRGKAA